MFETFERCNLVATTYLKQGLVGRNAVQCMFCDVRRMCLYRKHGFIRNDMALYGLHCSSWNDNFFSEYIVRPGTTICFSEYIGRQATTTVHALETCSFYRTQR